MCTSSGVYRLLHCLAFHLFTSFSNLTLGHLYDTDRFETIKSDQLVHHGGIGEDHSRHFVIFYYMLSKPVPMYDFILYNFQK